MVLRKYKPAIIGITGNVGKTSTKEAVVSALKIKYRVRGSQKSYNSELGVPLTILNLDTAWSSPRGWLKNIWSGFKLILFSCDYPEYLVLEIGADKPGDIENLVRWLPLKTGIITRVPDIPVHLEFFDSPKSIVKEKMNLAKAIPADGKIIINSDDKNIYPPEINLKASLVTFGLKKEAMVRGSDIAFWYDKNGSEKNLIGLSFKINHQGKSMPIRIKGVLGEHHVYTYLAAMAVALDQGINMLEAAEALENHHLPPGRLKILDGVKDSLILDDSYNSSPASLECALKALEDIKTEGRKIAIIGDMLELGGYTETAHRQIGQLAGKFCDYLILVGQRIKYTADEAQKHGFPKENILIHTDSQKAGKDAELLIQAGDVVLVKGSQSIRTEKAVEEIMKYPENKNDLLCRQDPNWQNK